MKHPLKRILAVLLSAVMVLGLFPATAFAAERTYDGSEKLYVDLNGAPNFWESDGAVTRAYFFRDTQEQEKPNAWTEPLEPVSEGSNIICASIPEGTWDKVILVRCNPSYTGNDYWSNECKWNQTGDIELDESKNLIESFDGSNGVTWGTYPPPEDPDPPETDPPEPNPEPEEPEYYLVGDMTEWQPAEDYKLTAAEGEEGKFILENIELAAGVNVKVYDAANDLWYPEGMNNNFVIAEDGTYDLEFYPAGNMEGFHGGFFQLTMQVPHEHEWEITYAWAEDNLTVTATAVCKDEDCGETVTETAQTSYEVVTEPTLTAEGLGRYTAQFENEIFETQTKEVPIPMLEPEEPEYFLVGTMTEEAWAPVDAYKLTEAEEGKFILADIELTAGVNVKVYDAANDLWYPEGMNNNFVIGEDGVYDLEFYPAGNMEGFHGGFFQLTMQVPHEHEWEITYAWAEDNSAVTATAVCKDEDCGETVTETAETSYEVVTEPTLTSEGLGRYTAQFENEIFETQTKEVPIPMLEPEEPEYYLVGTMTDPEWQPAEGYKLTAVEGEEGKFILADVELTAGTNVKVYDAANDLWYPEGMNNNFVITEDGVYDLEFYPAGNMEGFHGGFFQLTMQVPHEHEWEITYEWAEDNLTVTATAVCKDEDCGETVTETAGTSYEVVTEPTLTSEGLGRYTAEFENEIFETQTKEVPIPMLEPEEPEYFLVGTMTEEAWSPVDAYKLTEAEEGKFILADIELTAGTNVKVYDAANDLWYPEGMNNNFVITEDGVYDLEFYPAGNMEGFHGGFFQLTMQVPHEHEWEITYEWAEDNLTVTATAVCKDEDCGETVTETAGTSYEVVTEPTLTSEGLGRYTAEFENEIFETQTKEVPIPMLEPEEPEYYLVGDMTEWQPAEGYKLTKAEEGKFILADIELTAGVNVKVYDAANDLWYPDGMNNNFVITEDGVYDLEFYPAGNMEGFHGGFFQLTRQVPHEHEWEITYEWAEDNLTVTATAVCKDEDCGETVTETAETSYEVVTEPTLTSEGLGRYTAEFENEIFETQTKEVPIPMLEPEEPEYYLVGDMTEWQPAEDYKLTAAEGEEGKFILADIELTAGTNVKVYDAANDLWYPEGMNNNFVITEDGVYDLEFYPAGNVEGFHGGFFQLTMQVPHEHEWEITYAWAEDNSAVTATAVCKDEDCGETVTETAETSYEVVTEPTLTSEGLGRYTAEFENEIFETQTKEVPIPMLEPEEPEYYLVGTMTDPEWQPAEGYKLTAVEGEEGKFILADIELTAGTNVKVYDAANDLWYPDGEGNNFVISEDGTYDLEFYPAGEMGEEFHHGFFKLTKQETPVEPKNITVFFVDENNFGVINFYAFGPDNAISAEWPGEALESIGVDVNEHNVYKIVLDANTYDKVIFNNGADWQTVDISFAEDAGENDYIVYFGNSNEAVDGKYKVWPADDVEKIASKTEPTCEADGEIVYESYVTGETRSETIAHLDGEALAAAIAEAEAIDPSLYTEETAAALAEALAAAQDAYANAHTQDEVDAALEALQAALDGLELKPNEPKDITVFFVDENNFGVINFYAFGPNDAISAEWPGEALESIGVDVNEHNVYKIVLDANTYDKVIFNNGADWQTVDISFAEDAGENDYIVYFGNSNEAVDGKYKVWPADDVEKIASKTEPTCEADGEIIYESYVTGETRSETIAHLDGEALAAAIAEAEAIDPSLYTEETAAALAEALAAAQDAYANAHTQDEVDAALEALQAALDGLELKPNEPKNIIVFFVDENNFGVINFYAFGPNDAISAEWPGEALESIGVDVNEHNVYKIVLDANTYDKVIFNNGADWQTVDISFAEDAGENDYIVYFGNSNEAVDGKYKVWPADDVEKIASKTEPTCEADGEIVYESYVTGETRSETIAHLDGEALAAAIAEAEAIDPSLYTEETAAALAEALAAAQDAYANAHTQDEVDAALEALQAALDGLELKPIEPKDITVFFVDENNFGVINFYAFGPDNAISAEWPGEALESIGVDVNDHNVYKLVLDANTYDKVIFNNGADWQTVDISFAEDAGENDYIVYFGNSNESVDGKYKVWPADDVEKIASKTEPTCEADGEIVYESYVTGETRSETIAHLDGEALAAAIAEAEAIDPSLYTEETAAALAEALAAAQDAYANAHTQDEVDAALEALQAAIAALELKPALDPEFYLVGDMTEWQPVETYKLTESENEFGLFILELVDLTAGTGVKIYDAANDVWYPAGTDNNYVVAEDGTYDVFFYPEGGMGEEYHCGFFKLVKIEPPVVTVYYVDEAGLGAVSYYAFGPDGAESAAWPGTVIESIGTDRNGNNVYKIELNSSVYDNIIFTDGNGWQTMDLPFLSDAGENGYIVYFGTNDVAGDTGKHIAYPADDVFKVISRTEPTCSAPGEIVLESYVTGEQHTEILAQLNGEALAAAIAEAQAIDPELYTEESVAALNEALAAAQDAYANAHTQEEVDAALAALQAALDALELKPVPVPEYYLVGTMTEWQPVEAYKLVEAEEGRFILENIELTAGAKVKVYDKTNDAWFPDGLDNDYEVAEDGTYNLEFYPAGNMGDEFHGGFFKLTKVEVPEPEYYLVGTMTEWAPVDAYKLIMAEDGKFILEGIELTAGAKVKVYDKTNDAWFPDGLDNDYEVAEDGTYNLEFYPAGNMGDEFHGGFFKLTKVEVPEPEYYLVGTMTEWAPVDAYKLIMAEDGKFILEGIELTAGAKVKVYDKTNDAWFPDGMDNDYEVAEDGTYNLEFYPAGNMGDEFHGGFFKLTKVEVPNPEIITVFFVDEAGLENVMYYAFGANDAQSAAWPGTALTAIGQDRNGNNVYKIELDSSVYDHVIFTDGSGWQTVDLDFVTDAGENDYIVYFGNSNEADEDGHYKAWPADDVEKIVSTSAPTCTEPGVTVFESFVTGEQRTETVEALGHDWDDGVVTKEATWTEEGVITYTCRRCGETRTESIPMLMFEDVMDPEQYYYEPVYWAVRHQPCQITDGMTDTLFMPDASCTRAQVVTFLWRDAGCPEPTATNNPFTDVKETDWFYKAVMWAVENGITDGMTDTTFEPYTTCTRAQVVTFLWRFAGKPAPTAGSNPFTDVPAGTWYTDAVLWAVEKGITDGVTDTTFEPNSTCTRAHVVTFLYRYEKGKEAVPFTGSAPVSSCELIWVPFTKFSVRTAK